MRSKSNIRYIDLFAGIGGFKFAADQADLNSYNLNHVGFCEIDQKARMLYSAAHINGETIAEIDDALNIQTKKNKKGTLLPDFDMLFAGFPCQSFSNIGYRMGMEDKRGQLFYTILDVLDMYTPDYFILENVQKLSTINNGTLLSEMKFGLEEIGTGYHVHLFDLNAINHGLPQKRRRLFFCGIKKDKADKIVLSNPSVLNLDTTRYSTAWHLLEKGEVDPRHYIPGLTRRTVLFKNPNWMGDVNIDNAYARPITASMSKWHRANQDNYYSQTYIDSDTPFQRPEVNLETEPIRRITPLEGYRLQGFPDEFENLATALKLSYSAQYKMIGNAVPVNLVKSVMEHFINSY